MQLVLPSSVFLALLVVICIIVLDAFFGVIGAIKAGVFDLSKVPQFLATNVFPYCGGLLLLALAAKYLPLEEQARNYMFYAAAVPVGAKFIKELWSKIKIVLGITVDIDVDVKPPASKTTGDKLLE